MLVSAQVLFCGSRANLDSHVHQIAIKQNKIILDVSVCCAKRMGYSGEPNLSHNGRHSDLTVGH